MATVKGEKNLTDMSEIMADILWCTLREAPFDFETREDIEDNLEYEDAIILTENGTRWIREAILGAKERKYSSGQSHRG